MSLNYQLLEPGEGALLCDGLHRVYGDTYPIREFYDNRYVDEQIDRGKLHVVVARNETGEVVAQMSTVLEQPEDVTADGSALMVDQRYRGQGVVANLGSKMTEVYADHQLSGLHLYALALHDLVQNQSGRAGATVTGILPAWFSRQARVDGYAYPEGMRIGAVCLYMPLSPLPQRQCYLPTRYAEVLETLFDRLQAPRELLAANISEEPAGETVSRCDDRADNALSRLVVDRTGADFHEVLARFCREQGRDMEVLLLDLSLADEAIEAAVAVAREQDFFFGALMVDRCGADRLRLQCYKTELASPDAMVLASDEARELMQFVLADRDSLV